MPRLIVEAGRQIGSEFEIADRMKIGRLATCAAPIDDDNISREHCAIRLVKGRYYVLDLDSRNGTTVNGKRVKQSPLEPGDRIEIGDTVLLFYDEEHAARPTDTLGPEELKRATDEADAVEAEEEANKKAAAPPAAGAKAAAPPAAPPPANEAAEAALFALLLVLTFLCTSYATQIVLRVIAS